MTSDNSWSLIKFQEGQKVSSKSLNLDLLSEGSHVDDDILSNVSSSEELAEYSFRSANEGCQVGLGSISDSLATLTGSRSVCEKKKEYSWKINTWQVIFLTSLVSVSFSLGVQKIWNLCMETDENRDSMTTLLHKGGFPSDDAVIYSDLNFWATPARVDQQRDHDLADITQWRPSGKYYVDFDNRIAYPMPDEDIGWKRFEADSMILWYTLRSKVKSLVDEDTIKTLQHSYGELLGVAMDEAAWIKSRLLLATNKALKSTRMVWLSCKSRLDKSVGIVCYQGRILSKKWILLGFKLREPLKRFHDHDIGMCQKFLTFRQRVFKVLEDMHCRRH